MEARDASNVEDGVRFLTGILKCRLEMKGLSICILQSAICNLQSAISLRPVKLKWQSTALVMRRLWVRAPLPALEEPSPSPFQRRP